MATNAQQTGPMADLSGFQRDILTVIAMETEPHGLAIKYELQRQYGVQDINHGRLYPNLDELVEKGLVSKGTKDKRTNEYTLTARGRELLSADTSWREQALDGELDE